jgi:hypothetical protein
MHLDPPHCMPPISGPRPWSAADAHQEKGKLCMTGHGSMHSLGCTSQRSGGHFPRRCIVACSGCGGRGAAAHAAGTRAQRRGERPDRHRPHRVRGGGGGRR